MGDLEASKYQLVEWRISIYGRKADEWDKLAKWVCDNKLAHENVRWLIQVPRLYHVYRESGDVKNFGEMLDNIFAPLFAVSIDPQSNPALHHFLGRQPVIIQLASTIHYYNTTLLQYPTLTLHCCNTLLR